jgi:hypothetical protein
VPDRVVWVQQALFNLPMGTWSERKYVVLYEYIVAVLLCYLVMCISVIYMCLSFGTLIARSGQAKRRHDITGMRTLYTT